MQELTFFLLVHDVKHLWIFLQTHLGTFYHASISHLLYLYVDFEIKIFGVPFLNKYFSTLVLATYYLPQLGIFVSYYLDTVSVTKYCQISGGKRKIQRMMNIC